MKPAGQYVVDAYGLRLSDFKAEHGSYFLVHSAPVDSVKLDDSGDDWSLRSYQTTYGPNPAQMAPEVEAAFNAVRDALSRGEVAAPQPSQPLLETA